MRQAFLTFCLVDQKAHTCYIATMNNQYVTESVAARFLGVSRQYISKQIALGKIKGTYRLGVNVMVPFSWVEWKKYRIRKINNDAC